jgi:hypothetical protein
MGKMMSETMFLNAAKIPTTTIFAIHDYKPSTLAICFVLSVVKSLLSLLRDFSCF